MTEKQSKQSKQPKKPCAIARNRFMEKAPASIPFVINGTEMPCAPKLFKTGSFGYYVAGKVPVVVDGVHLELQVCVNATVVRSGDAKDE